MRFVTAKNQEWHDILVSELRLVKGSDFEAVDVSSLVIDSDSGQARQGPTDTEPPTAPTGLAPDVISSSQINLLWSPSTDNQGVAGYDIYRNGSRVARTTATFYQDTGLSPLKRYNYRVAAYDETGNVSRKSAEVVRKTQPSPSKKFSIGDPLMTVQQVKVRSAASSAGTVAGIQKKSSQGTVVAVHGTGILPGGGRSISMRAPTAGFNRAS